MRWMILAASLELAAMSAHAWACDPKEILQSDVDLYSSNNQVFISNVRSRLSSQQSSDSTSMGITYKSIPMNLQDASAMSSFLEEHSSYKMERSETESVLRTTLSPDSVRAYIACLGRSGVTIALPDAALDQPAFPITVIYHPQGKATPQTLLVEVKEGGRLVGSDFSEPMFPNENRIFHVERDVDKPLYIAASIAGLTDIVSLPPRMNFRVDFVDLLNPEKGTPDMEIKSDNPKSPDVRQLCIDRREGGLMIGSATVEASTVGGDENSGFDITPESNAYRVCAKVWARAGSSKDYARIRYRLRVMQAIIVPLDENGNPVEAATSQ